MYTGGQTGGNLHLRQSLNTHLIRLLRDLCVGSLPSLRAARADLAAFQVGAKFSGEPCFAPGASFAFFLSGIRHKYTRIGLGTVEIHVLMESKPRSNF